MLHGIASHRNRRLVKLLVGIGYSEILFEEIHYVRSSRRDILRLQATAAWHDDAYGSIFRAGVARLNDIQGADGDRHQVAGQRSGFAKLHRFPAIGTLRFRNQRRVGESSVLFRDVQAELPWHLVRGLVKTGKRLPGSNGFKLRVDVPAAAVLHLENALHVFAADLAFVLDVDFRSAGADWTPKSEPHQILRLRNHPCRQRLSPYRQRGVLHLEFLCIQPEYRGRLFEAELDIHGPGKGIFIGSKRQLHLVAQRDGEERQPELGRLWLAIACGDPRRREDLCRPAKQPGESTTGENEHHRQALSTLQ